MQYAYVLFSCTQGGYFAIIFIVNSLAVNVLYFFLHQIFVVSPCVLIPVTF